MKRPLTKWPASGATMAHCGVIPFPNHPCTLPASLAIYSCSLRSAFANDWKMEWALIIEWPGRERSPGSSQRGRQKHIGTSGDILIFGKFQFVMAQTGETRNEDHRRGRNPRHVQRVMAGPARQFHMRIPKTRSGLGNLRTQPGIEHHRRVIPTVLEMHRQPA